MGNKITRRRPAIDDRHTRLQGLYPSRDVDQRKLRRLILDSKLAPCYPGGEEPAVELEECPICFLHYPSLNRSKCCTKGICTECFLQVKSPNVTRPTQCPYCKMANYSVEYRGPKSMEEKGVEQAEEQKVIEAKIRMQQQELHDDEEREHRRDDDLRNTCAPPHHPIPSLADSIAHDSEQDNWRAVWETNSHPSQVSSLSEYTELDTFVSRLDDEFDLDLEDIMVMEAIWLSIQEQGARHRYRDDEPRMSTPSGSFPTLMTNYSLGSDGETDLGEIILPPPPPPPPLLPVPAPLSAFDIQEQAPGRHNSVTGGLAGAIAALAERQVAGGDTITAQQSILSVLPPDPAMVSRRKEVDNPGTNVQFEIPSYREEPHETADPSEPLQRKRSNGSPVIRKIGCLMVEDSASEDERGTEPTSAEVEFWKSQREGEHGSPQIRDSENPNTSEGLANWVSSTQQEYVAASMTKSSGDQSSEQVEVGTSFSSSIPSASELPWEAPEIPPDGRNGEGSSSEEAGRKSAVVPESFEEQMMLAMALSLAEAQANTRVHQDGGSPTQQSSNVQ
ncbi:unnamed protein product [Sphagnum jensenii]|uniref:RING-type domain-containing protein n=1 Tax=Sphagnum jensenii TaxID=128206 RepID=A0ABP0X8Y4_9BRYO